MKRLFLNFGAFLPYSYCNGPGRRASLWVKGCSIKCKGCFNPEFIKKEPENLVDVSEIIKMIDQCNRIEGLTITGGEPFDQAEPCFEIGKWVKNKGLNLLIFTGYTFSQLKKSKNPFSKKLIEISDILITGKYIEKLKCSSSLKGSRNQRIIILNKNIPISDGKNPEFEFIINKEGNIIISGFPPPNLEL